MLDRRTQLLLDAMAEHDQKLMPALRRHYLGEDGDCEEPAPGLLPLLQLLGTSIELASSLYLAVVLRAPQVHADPELRLDIKLSGDGRGS